MKQRELETSRAAYGQAKSQLDAARSGRIQDRTRIDDAVNDVVVVGIAEKGRAIVLATLARPEQPSFSLIEGATKASGWRFRAMPGLCPGTRY